MDQHSLRESKLEAERLIFQMEANGGALVVDVEMTLAGVSEGDAKASEMQLISDLAVSLEVSPSRIQIREIQELALVPAC